METKLHIQSRFYGLIILVLLVTVWIVLIPSGNVFADSNAPTVTASPQPTQTPISDTPTQGPPAETPYPVATDGSENILGATPIPDSGSRGGLSMINRVLLALLAVVTVLVIGMIVFLVYYQTRGGGLGEG